jgi:hypothetical protein
MKKFITSNGLTMLACNPLNFREESTYADGTGEKVYTISIGTMADMYNAVYIPDSKKLTICKITYNDTDPLSFYCTTFEQASIIIYSFGIGTFDADIFNDTIFTLKS